MKANEVRVSLFLNEREYEIGRVFTGSKRELLSGTVWTSGQIQC